MRGRSLLPCASIAMIVFCGAARGDDAAEAQRALDRGVTLYRRGDYPAARAAFEKARDLAPARSNAYRWLGLAEAELGHCVEAVANLEAFFSHLGKVPEEDARIGEARQVMARCRRQLPPRVGNLIVESTPPGAEVRLDGADGELLGTTPLRREHIPAGNHLVVLSAAGRVPLSRDVAIANGETLRIVVELIETAPPREPPAQAILATPAPDLPSSDKQASPIAPLAPARSSVSSRRWFWPVVGAGIVLVAGGIVAGTLAATLPRDPSPSDGIFEFRAAP